MGMKNMEFWDRVKKTDPRRVKQITGKQYKGSSPQPYYLVERMTEEFGMCGIGWGMTILNERMERLTDTDVLHVACVELWYMRGDLRGAIQQVGQTKAAYKSSKGAMVIDEDAPKKSVTDAMTKCMSYLGFSGDIFSGHWDDSKYVQTLTQEFVEADAAKQLEADMKAAADAIAFAESMDSLKAIFAGWYKHFPAKEHKAAIKALYDARKAELEPTEEKEAA
jgi:hypothetical protein